MLSPNRALSPHPYPVIINEATFEESTNDESNAIKPFESPEKNRIPKFKSLQKERMFRKMSKSFT